MRLKYTGLLIINTAALGLSAPTALADTQYGGAAVLKGGVGAPMLSLVRHDDGSVVARAVLVFACRGLRNSNLTARLKGTTADGVNFTARGSTRLGSLPRLRLTLRGTLGPDAVNGSLRLRAGKCRGWTRSILLHAESAPAGAPAGPPPGTVFAGLSAQAAGGVRLPVVLRVARNGRVYGAWTASMKCGPRATITSATSMPPTTVKSDGSFLDDKGYTVRYNDGSSERYTIRFEGRFLADGVVGTLRARMQTRKKGHRYYPCDSGTQTWSARP